jgi:hypothetical protein
LPILRLRKRTEKNVFLLSVTLAAKETQQDRQTKEKQIRLTASQIAVNPVLLISYA